MVHQRSQKASAKYERLNQLAPRSPARKSHYKSEYNYGATKEKEEAKLKAIENKITSSIGSFEVSVEAKLTNLMEKKMEEKFQNLKNELEILFNVMIQEKFDSIEQKFKTQIEDISDKRIPDLIKLEKDITDTISKNIVSNFVTKLPFMAEKLESVEIKNQMTQTVKEEEEKYFKKKEIMVTQEIQTEDSQLAEKYVCSQECQSEISHVVEIKEDLAKLAKKEKLKMRLQNKKDEPLPNYQIEAILRLRKRFAKKKLTKKVIKSTSSSSPYPEKYVTYSQRKTAKIVRNWM